MHRRSSMVAVAVTLLAMCLAGNARAEAVGLGAKARDFLSRLVRFTPPHYTIRSYVEAHGKTLRLSTDGPSQRIDTSKMPTFWFRSCARNGHIDMVYAATDVKGRRVIIDWGYTEDNGRAVIPFSKLGWH